MIRRTIAALAVTAAALAMGGAASSATTSIDLSTPEAVDAYLSSKGIDPATVVKQIGLKNYAGPAAGCPGIDWNCTTATRVVQFAAAGGQNRVNCVGAGCVAVQNGPDNAFRCEERSTDVPLAAQKCVVGQTGDRNTAVVRMLIEQKGGAVQNARQALDATQTAAEKNELRVEMTIKQHTTDVSGGAQKQDAHQAAFVNQNQTGAGGGGTAGNFLHVRMLEDQEMTGAATLQQQNTDPAPVDSTQLIDYDCAPFHKPAEPNQCALVAQDANGNTNLSQLHQVIDQDAVTTVAGATTQEQGREDGGIEGKTELVNPVGAGQNVDKAHQVVKQRADAPKVPPTVTVTQDQDTDPVCCGTATSIGGKASQEDVKQFVTQSASSETATQFAQLLGETTVLAEEPDDFTITVNGDTTAQGSGCKILHHARNNTGATNVHASEPAPCALVVLTTCGSASDVEPPPVFEIFVEDPEPTDSCLPPGNGGGGDDDEPPTITFSSTSPTLGSALEETSFDTPADFIGF